MSASNKNLLIWVALVVLVTQQVACRRSAIQNVFEKMDVYATGTHTSSGLTIDELKKALEEYNGWSEQVKEESKKVPLIKLAVDFVVHPMEFVAIQLRDEPKFVAKYIERAERAYKAFRPAYVDGQTFGGKTVKARNFFKILDTAKGKLPKNELTVKNFLMAKTEYESWREELDEITSHEDVYAMIGQLKMIFNYLNYEYVSALATGVFPYVHKKAQVNELLELFMKELKEKHGLVLKGEKFVRLTSQVVKDDKMSQDDTPLRETSLEEPVVEMISDDLNEAYI